MVTRAMSRFEIEVRQMPNEAQQRTRIRVELFAASLPPPAKTSPRPFGHMRAAELQRWAD